MAITLSNFLLLAHVPAQRTEVELRQAVADFVAKGTFLPQGADKVLGQDYDAGLPLVLAVFTKPESWDGIPEMGLACPATRAFDLLRPDDYPKALEHILPQVSAPSPIRRAVAARLLTQIGGRETVAPLQKLLADPHDLPAALCASGIDRYFETIYVSGGDAAWAGPLFDALSKVGQGPAGPAATPARALLMLDRAKAIPLVTSDAVLTKKNPKLQNLLWVLNDLSVPVPNPGLLKTLYKESLSGKTKDPEAERILLRSLATARVPESAQLIATALARPRPAGNLDKLYEWSEAQENAAMAFLSFHGFQAHPLVLLQDQINGDPDKLTTLPPHARTAVLVQQLQQRILFEGDAVESLREYLEEVPPAHYPMTVEALRTIKAPKAAQILANALKALGDTPLPADADDRYEALDDLDERSTAILEKAPAALIKAERLDPLLLDWILKHRADFPNPTPSEIHAARTTRRAGKKSILPTKP